MHYTAIISRDDEIVVPYDSPLHPVVLQLILNALDPADAQPVSCAGLPPLARRVPDP